jgi:hypothetical protein
MDSVRGVYVTSVIGRVIRDHIASITDTARGVYVAGITDIVNGEYTAIVI